MVHVFCGWSLGHLRKAITYRRWKAARYWTYNKPFHYSCMQFYYYESFYRRPRVVAASFSRGKKLVAAASTWGNTVHVITLAGLLHYYVTLVESSLQMLANIEKVMDRGECLELYDERSAYIGSSPTPPPSLRVETANVNWCRATPRWFQSLIFIYRTCMHLCRFQLVSSTPLMVYLVQQPSLQTILNIRYMYVITKTA